MPGVERVSPPGPEAAAELARERARELLRALVRDGKEAAAGLGRCRAEARAAVLAAVEGIEALAGVVQACADTLPAQAALALETAVRGAWERLEAAGLARDGAVGEAFDPKRHKLVKRRPAPGVAAGAVVQVLGAGVVFRGERLREAAVVVARAERSDAADRD
jgi:molecular chaperone GrpE